MGFYEKVMSTSVTGRAFIPANRNTLVIANHTSHLDMGLVKYALGSHDDIGDLENGDAEHGLSNWDKRHRYVVDQLGGRFGFLGRSPGG